MSLLFILHFPDFLCKGVCFVLVYGMSLQVVFHDLVQLRTHSALSIGRIPDAADDLLAFIIEIQAISPVAAFFHLNDRSFRESRLDHVDPFLLAAQRRDKLKGVVVVDRAFVVVDEIEEESESFALFPMIVLRAEFLHGGSFR